MGGYGSGRRKQHHSTAECLPIDLTSLLKKGYLTGKKLETGSRIEFVAQAKTVKEKITETRHALYLLVKRYAPGEADPWAAEGKLTLIFSGGSAKKTRAINALISPW